MILFMQRKTTFWRRSLTLDDSDTAPCNYTSAFPSRRKRGQLAASNTYYIKAIKICFHNCNKLTIKIKVGPQLGQMKILSQGITATARQKWHLIQVWGSQYSMFNYAHNCFVNKSGHTDSHNHSHLHHFVPHQSYVTRQRWAILCAGAVEHCHQILRFHTAYRNHSY